MSQKCKECRNAAPPSNGSERRCAFESGVFSAENWQCETLNKLRIIEEGQFESNVVYNDDHSAVLIAMDSEKDHGLFLLLTWYKNRGKTDHALIVGANGVHPLTLEAAEETLAYYQDDVTGAEFDSTVRQVQESLQLMRQHGYEFEHEISEKTYKRVYGIKKPEDQDPEKG